MNASGEQHRFALYIPSMDLLQPITLLPEEVAVGQAYTITNKKLIHRIRTVLRLTISDKFILFDATHHSTAMLLKSNDKRTLVIVLTQKSPHKVLKPAIHWLLPLLKRDAFEKALYSLTEMGATSIQPIFTTKTARTWGTKKDYARAHMIMVAASEQSKQFMIPTIHPVISLIDWGSESEAAKIFFDPSGVLLRDMLPQIEHSRDIIACTGPEGGLIEAEKDLLLKAGFVSCALTPTILRASQAVAVGLGVLRSYIRVPQ